MVASLTLKLARSAWTMRFAVLSVIFFNSLAEESAEDPAELVNLIFKVWDTKGVSFCEEAKKQVQDMEKKGNIEKAECASVYSPTHPFKGRYIEYPLGALMNMSRDNVPEQEREIWDYLTSDYMVKGPGQWGWFQNMNTAWTSVNNGLSDHSNMVIGNIEEAYRYHPTVQIGFMYFPPRCTYPMHVHTAHEIYHIIAGQCYTNEIANKTQPLVQRHPGIVTVTDPGFHHMWVTGDEGCLIVWLWAGDMSGYEF